MPRQDSSSVFSKYYNGKFSLRTVHITGFRIWNNEDEIYYVQILDIGEKCWGCLVFLSPYGRQCVTTCFRGRPNCIFWTGDEIKSPHAGRHLVFEYFQFFFAIEDVRFVAWRSKNITHNADLVRRNWIVNLLKSINVSFRRFNLVE